ncbi:MAG TPA: methyltransferase domain-containing protein [Anaerolineales bacterium]
MNLAYLVPRLVRHFLPESVTRWLLLRSVIIKPGLETDDPQRAVDRYREFLGRRGVGFSNQRILVFGYGGRFDVGIGLLQSGAAHVTLYDKYARPDDSHNLNLVARHPEYVTMAGGVPRPRTESLDLLESDLGLLERPPEGSRYDMVISSSVFEHVDDPAGITRTLAGWTSPNGIHVHFVDLRDHYFKYPFEMLRYSQATWSQWLNPTSNHNRLRLWDYQRVFDSNFDRVEIEVLERDLSAFESIRSSIRPEFISGDIEADSATLILIVARGPRT